MLLLSLLAQATTLPVTPDSSGIDPLALNLASITAVVVTATLIVQRIMKPIARRIPSLGVVPTQIYLVLIAAGLTYVANRFLLTLPGDNVWRLIRDTVVAVFASPGLYTMPEAWGPISQTKSGGIMLKKDTTVSVETAGLQSSSSSLPWYGTTEKVLVLAFGTTAFLALASGCTPSPAFYNGVKAQWPPIEATYVRYVSSDPTLSPQERSILLESPKTMDRLLEVEGKRYTPATQPAPTLP